MEYRNLTCSWHDLVLAIKSDVKTVLLSQAIRQNINLRLPFIGRTTRAQNQQLLATTIGDSSMMHPTVLYNSDTMNPSEMSSSIEQEEEEQKHKMKLVLGTKISKVKSFDVFATLTMKTFSCLFPGSFYATKTSQRHLNHS